MGLLDFLKINKKRNSEPENIDEIFKLAANDITYRPLFYRTILDTDLYLLTVPNEGRTEEANKVKVKNWEDGKIPIFTSTDKIFEKNIITEEENYIILKGKSVFENCPDNTTFVLNPYSTPSKEFTPSEIQKLISGELFKPDQQIPIKPGKNILISMPKENTSVIAESIRKYCTTRREISGAYLALMKDTLSEESAHLIIGLVVKGDLRQIFGELTEAIRPNIPKGEPVDMVDLNSGKNISNDLKRDEYKVY